MSNKKSITTFCALQILFFHLWIYIFPGNEIEVFLRQTAYIGVDVFFFLSGYSLAKRSVDNYKDFIFSRFKSVYFKFLIFVIIAWILKKWTFINVLKIALGINLLQKGGGAFLWFLPFIMLLYIFFPFFQKAHNKSPVITFILTLTIWITIGFCVNYLTTYRSMFIFWNRIPIFLLGFYFANMNCFKKLHQNKSLSLVVGFLLIAIGEVLIYYFGYRNKLMFPLTDMYYIIAMPAVIGVVLLLSMIPENGLTRLIGSSTLEIYGFQMTFGYILANKLILLSIPNLLVNIITFTIIIALAIIFNKLYSLIYIKK